MDQKTKVVESKIVDVIDGEFISDNRSVPCSVVDEKISSDLNNEFLESILDE